MFTFAKVRIKRLHVLDSCMNAFAIQEALHYSIHNLLSVES